MEPGYIELRDIHKAFGPVVANDSVSLSLRRGEIHALLGENGSGKSTLVNMLSGIYKPDGGSISIGGRQVFFASPRDAIEAGIGMVHQHFKLVDVLTAKENIVAGKTQGFFRRGRAMAEEVRAIADRYGLKIDPDKKVYNMSVGEKQTVEILKVLYRGAQVLILDEPTAVLTPQEATALFEILRNMRAEGCAVILITHKLSEVMDVSDRVTVLRKGRSIATLNTAETTPAELTEMMVGRAVELSIERPQTALSPEPMLVVDGLSVAGPGGVKMLDDFSFALHGGEILGVAGIAGSGQKELCETIAGLMRASGGSVRLKGEQILGLSPRVIAQKGVSMSFIPEDRLGMGLVAGMDIIDNVILKSYQDARGPFVDRESGSRQATEIVRRFDISTPSVTHVVKKLSGGNIQKVLLGREVAMAPELLITAYPVRGLDINASYNIYAALNEQKAAGVAVLFIGEDLDVLLAISDRLMVMHAGRLMGIVDPRTTTKEQIGLMMMGHSEGDGADV